MEQPNCSVRRLGPLRRSTCYPGPVWGRWKAAYPGGVTLTSRPGLRLLGLWEVDDLRPFSTQQVLSEARLRAVEGSLSRLRDFDITTWVVAARLGAVEGSLSRRRDFDITAWVAAALPAAAARLRYVRNLWQRAALQKNGISIFGTRAPRGHIPTISLWCPFYDDGK